MIYNIRKGQKLVIRYVKTEKKWRKQTPDILYSLEVEIERE